MQLVTGHAMVYLVNFHERLRAKLVIRMDHDGNEVITMHIILAKHGLTAPPW